MKKNLFYLVIMGVLISLATITGCNVIASLSTTSATGTDPGKITTPEAVVSGTVTKTGDTIAVNLSSIIVGGVPITGLDYSKFKIFIGVTALPDSTWTPVATTITTTTASKIDMVFILDNTGSMSGRIIAAKNSIAAFATSLEAAGADVKFGAVSFGDDLTEQSTLDCTTATAMKTWLTALSGVGGGDGPENPLSSMKYAYDNFTFRSGAQKVFIVIIDTTAHQAGDGTAFCAETLASAEASLAGNATVYAVSPKEDSDSYPSPAANTGTADIRWLVDGFGWFSGVTSTTYGVTHTSYTGTGGKWIELPASGDIDLTTLGISTTVTKGYTLSFTYKPTAIGTYYIHVLVDTNGDGVYDCDGILTISISTLSEGKWNSKGELTNPADKARPGLN